VQRIRTDPRMRHIPVVFLSATYITPEDKAFALSLGAVRFLEKPVDDQVLLDAIYQALEKDRENRRNQAEAKSIQDRLKSLTPREYEVFTLITTGLLNKQVAYELGTAEKTIKVHRARIMEKMHCESLAQLVRLAEKAGIR